MKIKAPALSTIVIYLIAMLLVSYFAFKVLEINNYNNSKWTLHSVNYGFVIAENDDGEQILARNPTSGLIEGDKVKIQGGNLMKFGEYK